MEHVELFSGILSGEEHDRFLSTWMIGQESREIVNGALDDDPEVALGVVLRDFIHGDSASTATARHWRGGRRAHGWVDLVVQVSDAIKSDGLTRSKRLDSRRHEVSRN